ncbi:MAG: hypothetical protein GTN59_11195 [Candidatus Dadabacteria bacterium]|nr:hypothetical protein [Candidatus Dadabacteria bacterium]
MEIKSSFDSIFVCEKEIFSSLHLILRSSLFSSEFIAVTLIPVNISNPAIITGRIFILLI